MKKFLSVLTAATLCFCLVACGSTDNNSNTDSIDSAAYRVGIGSYTTTDSSYPSIEGENGKSIVSTTYATVIFDSNDIIKKVYIDQVESKVHFDSNGQIVTDGSDTNIRTKRELGDEYGMKEASHIGKEWYEQINSIESWLVGKNIKDIANGVMNNNMYGSDAVSDSVTGKVEGAADGIIDSAESIASDIAEGAKGIIGGMNDTTNNDTTGTMRNGGSSAVADSNSISGSMNDISSSDGMDNSSPADSINSNTTSDNMNSNNAVNSGSDGNSVNWDEDLKAFATIDTTDIQMALQKAYANAK